MTAEEAEVVGQDVAVERLAELSAKCAAADTAGQAAENCARYGAEADADWPGECANSCACLTTGEGSADAARNTAHGADSGADFHGVVEGSDFGRLTARTLQ